MWFSDGCERLRFWDSSDPPKPMLTEAMVREAAKRLKELAQRPDQWGRLWFFGGWKLEDHFSVN